MEISVYLDDFVGSHSDKAVLREADEDIRTACVVGEFIPNPNKLTSPRNAIVVFNCDLVQGSANVTRERVAKFYANPDRSSLPMKSFEDYRARVAEADTSA